MSYLLVELGEENTCGVIAVSIDDDTVWLTLVTDVDRSTVEEVLDSVNIRFEILRWNSKGFRVKNLIYTINKVTTENDPTHQEEKEGQSS